MCIRDSLDIERLQLISDTAVISKGMTLYGLEITEVIPTRVAV